MTAKKVASPADDELYGDQFAVRVKVTREQADALLRRGDLDFGDHPRITENPDGGADLDLFPTRAQIETLRAEGYQVEVGHNLSSRARERIAEFSEGDRFDGGKVAPTGFGRKVGGRGRGMKPPGGRDGQPS